MILCEKPLSRTLEEGQRMVDAIAKAGVKNTIWYNYRRVPAVTLAKNLIDSGKFIPTNSLISTSLHIIAERSPGCLRMVL